MLEHPQQKSPGPFQLQSRRGLTLVEVMVAMIVFGIAAVAIIQTVLTERKLAEVSLRSTTARAAAQSVIEQTRNVSFDTLHDVATFTVNISGTSVTFTKGTAQTVPVTYQYTGTAADTVDVAITYNVADQNPVLGRAIKITVDYSWPKLKNSPQTLTGRLQYIKSSYEEL